MRIVFERRVHVGQQLVDRAAFVASAEELTQGLFKFGLRGDAASKLAFAREDLR